jgi:long-chain acyl-CoA synthetase
VNFWQVFDDLATRFADRVAVEVQRRDGLERRSYGELRALAVSRAAWLAEQDLVAGDRCAILAENDAWWCGAYLGILRLGAVAVPLDTNYSATQVATILRDSGARVVFASRTLAAVAREALRDLPSVIVLDIAREDSWRNEDRVKASGTTERDAAVILYTSGTTADPKGVVLSHGNLIAERDAAFQLVSVSQQDSVLGVLPLFHALAQPANLLLPFAVGARVVFLETLSSSELLRALAEREVSIFACAPQLLYLIHERLMHEVEKGGWVKRVLFARFLSATFALRRVGLNLGPLVFARVHKRLGPKMRLFITGGSKFDPAIGRDFYALGFTVLQAYGLTETTGAATLTRPNDAHLDTVGRALPGQEIKVLPPAEEGLDGEIAIRGPVVMQGYYNRPDANRALSPDGWFFTGDLGRLDERGRLTITGRKKEIIVLANGKKIYPEEVEAQYRQSAFIKEICVIGVTSAGEPNAERLYAVVVPDQDLLRAKRIANAGELLRFEIEGQSIHLPPYKRVLGYEIWFEPLPRTTTGKLKRHEIERRVRANQQRATTAATTPQEDATAWSGDPHVIAAAEVIRARARGRRVAPQANLELDLGLDSMERVALLTELEQRFGVRVVADRAHEILTVAQLIDAVRPGEAANQSPCEVEQSWAVLLRDARRATDSEFQHLLARRPLAVPICFAVSRMLRLFLGPSVAIDRQHLPPDGPYIISPNHQGYLDPMILCAVLPYRVFKKLFFVGAAEYFETPLTKWLARKINLMPVDPDANLVSAMKASAFGLQHERILMLFPEGERSIDGTVKRFKKGAPILAQHLSLPIVPVAIKGAFELWPRSRSLNWRLLRPWSSHRVRVRFGEALRFEAAADYGDSANRLRNAVDEMWTVM